MTLAQLIANHELALPDDRQLLDELARVRLRESAPGVIRMDHNPGEHDDQAIAIALAAQELLARTSSRLTIATASELRIPLRSGPRPSTPAVPPVASPFLRQLLKTRGPFE